MAGNLYSFGLGALERLCERMEAGQADPEKIRSVLEKLSKDLGVDRDPTRTLLMAVRYHLPAPGRTDDEREVEDQVRRQVVREAVERSAEGLLSNYPDDVRRELVVEAIDAVTHMLGIFQTVGGSRIATTSGLFDTSTRSLERLLEQTRLEAGRAVDQLRGRLYR